jgi:hypothetical protein
MRSLIPVGFALWHHSKGKKRGNKKEIKLTANRTLPTVTGAGFDTL